VNVAILGGGSFGTALAAHLTRSGHAVRLWLRDARVAQAVAETRENPRYLPGIPLPRGIVATREMGEALAEAEAVFMVVPSASFRAVCREAREGLPARAVLVSATKGIEIDTLSRMSEVAACEMPGRAIAVLSGPSFAEELAREQPTAVVVASARADVAERVQRAVAGRAFRAYSSDDVVGVELAGALKNVIAIAAGIVDGLGYGSNTAAALITRGLAEMTRLVGALGGRPDTLAGLAGLGDLVLTCTGALSRNRRVGQALGRGKSLSEALAETRMVAEGVPTTQAAAVLAARSGLEMPIVDQMRAVLYDAKRPRDAVDELMLRTLKRE
jgi:glycerol-3-phosphate dehydrogenase (NAD(P)+)